jgi:hypothetical protein
LGGVQILHNIIFSSCEEIASECLLYASAAFVDTIGFQIYLFGKANILSANSNVTVLLFTANIPIRINQNFHYRNSFPI